ncbi:hypothetical protein HDA41_006545 [Streptomyces caelestis]|uniref:Uncharacterized protein n=1 Tax=Streptomyces caelestis TaxID=36816 RepID=A0A7W9LWC3_9ACTN|nr:hypothetical protein [Streptomyces caelestis]
MQPWPGHRPRWPVQLPVASQSIRPQPLPHSRVPVALGGKRTPVRTDERVRSQIRHPRESQAHGLLRGTDRIVRASAFDLTSKPHRSAPVRLRRLTDPGRDPARTDLGGASPYHPRITQPSPTGQTLSDQEALTCNFMPAVDWHRRPWTISTTCAMWYREAHSPAPQATRQDPDQVRTNPARPPDVFTGIGLCHGPRTWLHLWPRPTPRPQANGLPQPLPAAPHGERLGSFSSLGGGSGEFRRHKPIQHRKTLKEASPQVRDSMGKKSPGQRPDPGTSMPKVPWRVGRVVNMRSFSSRFPCIGQTGGRSGSARRQT